MISQTEMQGIVSDSLERLGVVGQERELYLLSLQLGPTSVANLATHLSVSRPQAYKLIADLESHGLATFSTHKKFSRTFMVESPSKIQELLRKHNETLAQTSQRLAWALPDLLTKYQQGDLPSSVRLFQGRDQFLKLFFQINEEAKDESCFLGSAQDFIAFISWAEERRWIADRVARNQRIRCLLFESEDTKTLEKSNEVELRDIRYLKGAKPFITGFQLFANKVILWQPKAPLAVLIEDAYFVEMLQSLFEKLWEEAKN